MRFPGFEREWVRKELGEIGEIVSGLTYSPEEIDKNGVLVLRSSNVQDRTLTFNDNVFVKTNYFNAVLENDILICVRNGSQNLIGKNTIIKKEDEEYAFGAFMTVYRSPYNKFLTHWFDTNEYKEIVYKNLGATINSINGSDLKKFKVPFPVLPEQQVIANFFSLIEDRIQTQNKIIKQLETLMQILREKLFKQKLRFNGEHGNDFRDWEVKKLEEVCEIIGGGTPETNKNEYWNGNIQWFTPSEIKTSFVSKSERTITELGLKNSSAKILPKGAILLTTRATIGELAIALVECTTNQGFQSLVPKEGYNNVFLFNWIKENKYELTKRASGSTFPEISKSEIEKIEISIPSQSEQNHIANFLSSIDGRIEMEKKLQQQYISQKKYLLQNLFI